MALVISDLTQGTLAGTGVFDELMKSVKAHLTEEYDKGRIKGNEYASVYLGALNQVMDQALAFLLKKQTSDLEVLFLQAQIDKLGKEILLVEAQEALAIQQKENLAAEALNIPKIGDKLDAETDLVSKQSDSEVVRTTVLTAEKCLLEARFDTEVENKLKTAAETTLLNQKKVTEQAQTSGTAIDADSVIGKQISLYSNQAAGFVRDAEQKAAQILADTWKVRRTTDEGTVADSTNMLYDTAIGRAINKLLTGVQA
jgi:hypothetical protein